MARARAAAAGLVLLLLRALAAGAAAAALDRRWHVQVVALKGHTKRGVVGHAEFLRQRCSRVGGGWQRATGGTLVARASA
jgi:hypothetical protein